MTPINVIEEITKPITLTFRLFGNLFAGGLLIVVVAVVGDQLLGQIGGRRRWSWTSLVWKPFDTPVHRGDPGADLLAAHDHVPRHGHGHRRTDRNSNKKGRNHNGTDTLEQAIRTRGRARRRRPRPRRRRHRRGDRRRPRRVPDDRGDRPPARGRGARPGPYFFLTVGLVEAMYFINLLFMVVFVYVFSKK